MPTSQRAANGQPYDITIVGAGMAGLYSAWRLLSPAAQQSPLIQQLIAENGTGQLQICLLEQSDRVGGRLDSYTFKEPGGVEVTVELGGMRYQTTMKLVAQLIQTLGLPSTNFPISNNRLFYLRGTQIWENEIKNPAAPVTLPYQLPDKLLHLTPDDLFNWVVINVTGDPKSKGWSSDQWKQYATSNAYTSPASNPVQVFKNMGFFDIGFWNLLYDQVGDEGYRYLTEAGGYDSNTINWNSALAMPYVASGDYSSSATYQRLVDGYQALPKALAQAIGGSQVIQLRTILLKLTKDSNGLLNLTVGKGPNRGVIQSKYVMLCMPRRALELLDPDTPLYHSVLGSKLKSVLLQPSFKLLLLFDTEWWKQVNIRGTRLMPYGPSITDLPLRMIWYFDDPQIRRSDGRQVASKYWALLASYSDMVTEQFWIELRNTLVPGGGVSGPAIPAPPAMVNMALYQLGQVHGMTIPQPVAAGAMYKDWGADPFYGAGYHAWATHVQPYIAYELMFKPMDDYNVFAAGEAYSLDQGWVEGALRTAETVLTRYFQLPVFEGVHPEYVKKGKGHG
jgi:monoamine oxidase